MGGMNSKLADSLEALLERQGGGRRIFRSSDIPRDHRERLLRNGFLAPVTQGWLMLSTPSAGPRETTPWFASAWEFCARYCERRFGGRWHLSAPDSLVLQAGSTSVPKRIRVQAERGTNHSIALPFDTSLTDLAARRFPPAGDLTTMDGLRVLVPEAALVRVPSAFFRRHAVDARTVLTNIRDVNGLVRRLVVNRQPVVAGRLAGAFRHVGMETVADGIARTMRDAESGYRERNPFEGGRPERSRRLSAPAGPVANVTRTRLSNLWAELREPVLGAFPAPPGIPATEAGIGEYLKRVDEVYVQDAYHSLSIEGYEVTREMLARVRAGQWDPLGAPEDREWHNALAARGYWQAFRAVSKSLRAVLAGQDAGRTVRAEHGFWHQQMFQPLAAAGMLDEHQLAGYRNHPVYLRGSRHVPMRWERLGEAMGTLFDLLDAEPEPAVRAAGGYLLFGYVHPHPDGNGRSARFLMNVMLASGGYPWTVIRLEDRRTYLDSLEAASVSHDFEPYANFLGRCVRQAMDAERSAALGEVPGVALAGDEEGSRDRGQEGPAHRCDSPTGAANGRGRPRPGTAPWRPRLRAAGRGREKRAQSARRRQPNGDAPGRFRSGAARRPPWTRRSRWRRTGSWRSP